MSSYATGAAAPPAPVPIRSIQFEVDNLAREIGMISETLGSLSDIVHRLSGPWPEGASAPKQELVRPGNALDQLTTFVSDLGFQRRRLGELTNILAERIG